MNYADYVSRLNKSVEGEYFIKLAEKKKKRSLAKDVALVGAGTAAGAGLGYGASALFKKRYKRALEAMPPQQRLRLAVPAAAGVGGLLALTHVLRERADRRRDEDQ